MAKFRLVIETKESIRTIEFDHDVEDQCELLKKWYAVPANVILVSNDTHALAFNKLTTNIVNLVRLDV